MKLMKSSLPLLLFVSFLAAGTFKANAIPAGINIIQNGDFEILGDHDFPPWQFSNGFAAFVNEPFYAFSGGNFILPGGRMWQDLNTEIGQSFRLSYYQRGDDPGQSERSSTLNVLWGNQQVASHTRINFDRTWVYAEFDVTATSLITRLTFERAPGSYGLPSVDLVRVVSIPEPSALAFAGLALGAVFRHRRKLR
jgi:hypothetical protein